MRAVHEYGTYPKKYGFEGTYLWVDSDYRAARILKEDDKSVAWVGRDVPWGWRPHVRRTRENCPEFNRYRAALKKGYLDIAWKIARQCGIKRHEHIIAQKGRHGQRSYPSALQLKPAIRAKLIVLSDTPPETQYWLDVNEIGKAADAAEWLPYQGLLSCLEDILLDVDENGALAGDDLQAAMLSRVPELGASLAGPITMGTLFDPKRALPTVNSLLKDFEDAPSNVQLVLEAIQDEHIQRSNKVSPLTWRMALHGRNGRAPGVMLHRGYTLADIPKVSSRRVVLSSRRVGHWQAQLESWGLTPLCWGEVLDRVPDRRGDGVMRWAVEASAQLILKGVEIRQATLAREVGVDRATISRNFNAIMRRLGEWQFLRPQDLGLGGDVALGG